MKIQIEIDLDDDLDAITAELAKSAATVMRAKCAGAWTDGLGGLAGKINSLLSGGDAAEGGGSAPPTGESYAEKMQATVLKLNSEPDVSKWPEDERRAYLAMTGQQEAEAHVAAQETAPANGRRSERAASKRGATKGHKKKRGG